MFLLVVIGLSISAVFMARPEHARAQGLRDAPSSLRILDQSVLERLGNSSLGPSKTDQKVVSPVDSALSGQEVERGFRVEIPDERGSRLESDYKDRLNDRAPRFAASAPAQFGYDLLRSLDLAGQPAAAGAINDSYVLGMGDELVITFRGQVNKSYRTSVDREGQVVLPDMPPVSAAGLSFGRFQAEIGRRTKDIFAKTDVFASLGRVRNFPVLVVGQVNRPGIHRVTGVASILDAIVAAGGVRKSGSLRDVRLIRRGRVIRIDLYALFLTGRLGNDISLSEGDRVFIPPLGHTVGIVGDVQRPAIYELAGKASRITGARALELSGGTLRPSGYRYLLISGRTNGGDTVRELDDIRRADIGPGDILLVAKRGYGWTGGFFVDGHVTVAGPRSLTRTRTIGSVVNAQDVLGQDPYALFAVLERTDPKTQARHMMAVDLARIRARKGDAALQPNDRLIVLAMDDVKFLSSEKVQAVLDGRSARQTNIFSPTLAAGEVPLDGGAGTTGGACLSLNALAAVVSRTRTERFAGARLAINPEKRNAVPTGTACPAIYDRFPALLPFVLDYAVAITGEVRQPGVYPVTRNTALATLVPVVGGLGLEADLTQIEVTRFNPNGRNGKSHKVHSRIDARSGTLSTVALSPGDIVRFNPRFSQRDIGTVFLSGEVKRPGVYAIRRGEKLSGVIMRAGGLSEEAFPLGAMFTRTRVKRQEEESFKRAALDLQSGLAEALASRTGAQSQNADPGALVLAVKELATTLRQTRATGRVVVESDPTVLQVKPELDTVLEAGDRLHIPKRPNHVTVSGQVLNSGAIQFRSGKTVDEYIQAAGGISRAADDGRTFVVFPNGEAKPVSVSSWNFTSVRIPPGSTIVIPRDPKPFDTMAFTVSIADILSKLAITAASVAVIGRN